VKKKLIILFSMCIILSGAFGTAVAYIQQESNHNGNGYDMAAKVKFDSLEEELYEVDLIIKGNVVRLHEGKKRDSGINNYAYEITPADIEVEEVIYGDTSLLNSTITYLQHGTPLDKDLSKLHVKEGEEVILFLIKTTDGKYWSYNFDDGIWKIQNGTTTSTTNAEHLKELKGMKEEKFKDKVAKAAKNKKKNKNIE
jgi:hypothetical protein